MKKIRILSIDPSARELGFVVLEDQDLLDYGVKSLKNKRPKENLTEAVKRLVDRLINSYGIDVIITKQIEDSYNTRKSYLPFVVEAITRLGNEIDLPVIRLTIHKSRSTIIKVKNAKRIDIIRLLVSRYPELEKYQNNLYTLKGRYWQHLFDSLTLGLSYLRKR